MGAGNSEICDIKLKKKDVKKVENLLLGIKCQYYLGREIGSVVVKGKTVSVEIVARDK